MKLICALAAAVLFLVGCGGDGQALTTLNVRALNTVPGKTFSVLTGAGSLSSGLAPGAVTDYTSQYTSLLDVIQITDTSNSAVFYSDGVTVSASSNYTFIIGGQKGSDTHPPVVWAITDDASAPSTGTARVRFFNATPTNGSVDVYVTDASTALSSATATYSSLSYGSLSSASIYTAGSKRIRITPAGSKASVLADLNTLSLADKAVRTIVISDESSGTGANLYVLGDLN